MKTLQSTINKDIEVVHHLADIHIRNDRSRHKEYKQVFKQLFKQLLQETRPAVTVVCGDIVHNKTILRPECIELVKYFFTGLAKITDVVVILGNHDCNVNNDGCLDSLTPIISKDFTTDHKIFLLKKNKLYQYNNIIFGVTTVSSVKVTPIPQNINNKIKIALYHGMLNGVKLDNDFKVTNHSGFNVSDFKDYDLVMLGDIHKHQFLNKQKTIGYSSSLIQQNFGESIDFHGYLDWDLDNKINTFYEVPNNCGFVTYHLTEKNGLKMINNSNNKLPSKPRIRLIYDDISDKQILLQTEQQLRKTKNIIEFFSYKNDNINLNTNTSTTNYQFTELKSQVMVKEMILDFLKSKKLDNLDKIMNEIQTLSQDINYNFGSETKHLQLEHLEFSNLFSYGENNKIEFNKMKNIVGIVAKNGHGKSSLIDSILYGVYGKFSRGERFQAVNINRTKAESCIKLKINNHDFEIHRKIVCNKKNSYEIKFTEDGKTITDDEKTLTSKLVDDKISPYEDLINTSIILQYGDNFLDLDPLKKKEYICRLLGLDVINLIIKKAKFQTNSLRQTILQYQKDLTKYSHSGSNQKAQEMSDIKAQQKTVNRMLIKTEMRLEKNKEKIIRLGLDNLSEESYLDIKTQWDKVQEKITHLKQYDDQDKNNLESEINELIKSIKDVDAIELDQCEKLTQQFNDLTKQLDKCKNNIDNINNRGLVIPNDPELESNYQKLLENQEINNNLIKNKKELKNLTKKISELETHVYNQSCDACMSNPVTKQKLYLEKEKDQTKSNIIELKSKLHQNISDSIQAEYDNYRQLIQQITQDQQDVLILQKDQQLYLNLLDQLSHRLDNCGKLKQQQEQNIINNSKIIKLEKTLKNVNNLINLKTTFAQLDEKYKQYEQMGLVILNKELSTHIIDYKKQLDAYQSSLDKLNQEIGILKQQQDTAKSLENKIAELNDQKDLDDQIAKLLDKNGMIDYLLNSKILPQLQSNVNQVLSYVANFSLVINYDHTGIRVYKDVNGKKLDVTSLCGFERFITNIAFRLTFNKLNGKIKTDFLIIDEGFSCCDEENIDKLKALFDYIRNNYKWCLVITHLEEIKNNFDSMLFIEREDDVSRIIG